MRNVGLMCSIVSGGAYFGFTEQLSAQTIQTFGAGSAVTTIGRAAAFESITQSGIPLSDYTEDRMFIGANADSLIGYEVFGGANPSPYFYCLDGGSMGGGADSWVTIYATDSARIYGIEFLYGNSWTNGGGGWGNNDAWVTWQTLNGTTVASSGQAGPYGGLYVGGIIGFYDPNGFDTLQVKCNAPNQADPNIQALALDNLHVQLTNCGGVNNCSGHGVCVATNTCNCDAGWTGADCATAVCAGVNNCSAHGTCIAPNTCQCDHQWIGTDCSTGPIPAVSEWGLIILSLAILSAGAAIMAKRTARTAQPAGSSRSPK
jgi:hypothetical protein